MGRPRADSLWINGRNILNAANAPRTKRVIGIFAFDADSDGVTDLSAPLPAFFSQTFITGMDVFIPAPVALRVWCRSWSASAAAGTTW